MPVTGRRRAADAAAPQDSAWPDGTGAGAAARTDSGRAAAAAADVARALAAQALSGRPPLAGGPEPVAGWGAHAYGLELATDDPAWSGPLVVRAGEPTAAIAEHAWVGVARAAGVAVPDTVAHDPVTGSTVFRRPPGTPLNERMVGDMAAVPAFLAELGRLHAGIHAVPVPQRPAGPTPLADVDTLAAVADHRAVGDALGAEIERLTTVPPPAAAPVVCHGLLNPIHVVSDGPPGHARSVAVNWTHAGLGDAELDVAGTLAGFWSAAVYIDGAVPRRLYRMARDSLAAGYLDAYEAAAPRPLDGARLRYWQAVALCRLAAGVARLVADGPADPWDPAAAVARPRAALDELCGRVRELMAE